ncbi:TetR/AcrR family transcriptional regulator [Nocardia takedensis]
MRAAAVTDGDPGRGLLDRRAAKRGDERRLALLRALDERLKVQLLEEINVADITADAGVTRSAFYFYFEDKAAGVAALGEQMHHEVLAATNLLISGDGPPAQRVAEAIRGVFASREEHRHLFHAMLTARRSSRAVRDLWDRTRTAFVAPLASMIEAERAAGAAPPGPDSDVLAAILLELNERALEQDFDPAQDARRIDTLIAVWLRAIYGSVE